MDLKDFKLQTLGIAKEKLANFVNLFSEQKRFYYGWNPRKKKNWHIAIKAERCGFIKNTKPLFSGDSDFTYLASFLKKNNKKFIVVASGQVFHTLTELADLYINAQLIKANIASIKETSPREGRGLDIGSGSAGQGNFRYNK